MPKLPSSSVREFERPIFKERGHFDFYLFVHAYLSEKTQNGFLNRKDVFRYLCRRFSFEKHVVKNILIEMRHRELIKNTKLGILLLGVEQ